MENIKKCLQDNKTQITWFLFGVLTVMLLSGFCKMLMWNHYSHAYDKGYMKSRMSKEMRMMDDTDDMGGMMMNMTDNLKGKTGDDLDKSFLLEMISHHAGAIDMAKIILASSTNTNLKNFANRIIEAQSREIEQMKTWVSEYK